MSVLCRGKVEAMLPCNHDDGCPEDVYCEDRARPTLEQVTRAAGQGVGIPSLRRSNWAPRSAARLALVTALRAMVQAPTLDALLSDVVAR